MTELSIAGVRLLASERQSLLLVLSIVVSYDPGESSCLLLGFTRVSAGSQFVIVFAVAFCNSVDELVFLQEGKSGIGDGVLYIRDACDGSAAGVQSCCRWF